MWVVQGHASTIGQFGGLVGIALTAKPKASWSDIPHEREGGALTSICSETDLGKTIDLTAFPDEAR